MSMELYTGKQLSIVLCNFVIDMTVNTSAYFICSFERNACEIYIYILNFQQVWTKTAVLCVKFLWFCVQL
jgi:hypothetical protein